MGSSHPYRDFERRSRVDSGKGEILIDHKCAWRRLHLLRLPDQGNRADG